MRSELVGIVEICAELSAEIDTAPELTGILSTPPEVEGWIEIAANTVQYVVSTGDSDYIF